MKLPDLLKVLQEAIDPKINDNDLDACWQVLSALRGPDENVIGDPVRIGRFMVKQATTAVIRWKVFDYKLNSLDIGQRYLFDVCPDTEEMVKIRETLTLIYRMSRPHFIGHAKKAFEVLDLKWDGLNLPPKE